MKWDEEEELLAIGGGPYSRGCPSISDSGVWLRIGWYQTRAMLCSLRSASRMGTAMSEVSPMDSIQEPDLHDTMGSTVSLV